MLGCARLLGSLARRFGQPDIVGSLTAGILLGPTVLGHLSGTAERWLVPQQDPAQLHLLGAVTGFSLLVMLVVLGAEVDLGLLRKSGKAAATISAGSIVVPAVATVMVVWLLAGWLPLGAGGHLAAALAVGGALSVSSLPVVARVITELGLTRRDAGQLSLAVASINDIYGFLLLVPLSVLAGGGGVAGAVIPVAGLLCFGGVLALAGQPVADRLLRLARAGGPNPAGSVTISLVLAAGAAAAAQAARIDPTLGAFGAGIVLSRSRFQQTAAMQNLQTLTTAVFAPLFFASAGLQANAGLLRGPGAVAALVIILVAACASKFLGSLTATLLVRLPARDGKVIGVALNGRGTMQVIIGTFALRSGLIDRVGYSALLLISIIASLALSPLLRRAVTGWEGSDQERERLTSEAQLSANVIVKGQRLLLPTRGSINGRAAALVMDRAWPQQSELTVLTITANGTEATSPPIGDQLSRPVRRRHVTAGDEVRAVLTESMLGYGIIGVGAVDEPTPGNLLPEPITALLNQSPLPLLVVRGVPGREPPTAFRRIAAAVNGTGASRAGQEVAQALARRETADLHLLHVATRSGMCPADGPGRAGPAPAPQVTERSATDAVLAEARLLAQEQGVTPIVSRLTSSGGGAGAAIVSYANRVAADAVVVGTRVRRLGERPFLGHSVEHVLEHCTGTTVIVIVLPDTYSAGDPDPFADRTSR